MRIVIIGHGMAGARLAAEITARDPDRRCTVTVFGAESHPAYNRILLSNVLAGHSTPDDIRLPDPPIGVRLHTGLAVTRIDRQQREVVAADGSRTPYDALVLATGSRPVIPPLNGLHTPDGALLPGAEPFRAVEDCERILAAVHPGSRVVVLGGGLLGLEAARGLARRGLDVELVHPFGHLMERQLDPDAGRVLARTITALGIRLRLDSTAARVSGPDRVRALILADGSVVPADLLLLTCGVQPEIVVAEAAGLAVGRGIEVDDGLRSVNDPHVYAIGECAEHAGNVYGLVAPAWEQAVVLADRLTGADPTARYTGSGVVTRLKADGVDLAAMGDSLPTDTVNTPGLEVVSYADSARGTYKKVVIRDGRLVGAIMLGDIDTVGTVTQLYDRGSQVPADRPALLFAHPRANVTPDRSRDEAIVCRCNGVTAGALRACHLAGARSLPEVEDATRAMTGCGSCRDTVSALIETCSASSATAAPVTREAVSV